MKRLVSAVVTLAIAIVVVQPSVGLAAGGVVGNGTPASCTEVAFDTVFFKAQSSGGGVITFNCGGAPQVVVFRAYKPVATNTEIQGGDLITLSGANTAGVFQISTTGSLKLSNLTVTRGYGTAGAIENFGRLIINDARLDGNAAIVNGGAVTNHAEATLTNVVITGNEAAEDGGGVYTDGGKTTIRNSQIAANRSKRGSGLAIFAGVLEIEDSSITRNSGSGGGGILVRGTGIVTTLRTVVAGNAATEGAGVLQLGGTITMDETIISGNGGNALIGSLAVEGGGFNQAAGNAVLTNVSIVGNRAADGGGLGAYGGTIALTNVTISGNKGLVETGGGRGPAMLVHGGNVTLTNVTIAGNDSLLDNYGAVYRSAGTLVMKSVVLANGPTKNCEGAIVGATFSYSSDATCNFGATRDSATLPFEALATNGGFTLTQMPLPGNAAIDNGAGVGCPNVDQRGVLRPSGLACDAGAVEYVLGAASLATVFEYYNVGFGHYFVTLLADEIAKLDAGVFVGWQRTGQQFNVHRKTGASLAPVCRFFTVAFAPKSSHFYAPRGFGCEGTLQNKDWQFEDDVFFTPIPNGSGQCPAGYLQVFRLYNSGQGGAPNHRFTVDPVIRTQMIARGYVGEGAGVGVGMCSPQ